MKLAAARAIIESAPRTHLGEAAHAVLKLLDACDIERLDAAEAHLSVQAEALAVAREEAEAADKERARMEFWVLDREQRLSDVSDRWRAALTERDRLARELEEARQPDPDLMRLRALEVAAEAIVRAKPPLRVEGRAAYDYIVSHLTPYLAEPKVGA